MRTMSVFISFIFASFALASPAASIPEGTKLTLKHDLVMKYGEYGEAVDEDQEAWIPKLNFFGGEILPGDPLSQSAYPLPLNQPYCLLQVDYNDGSGVPVGKDFIFHSGTKMLLAEIKFPGEYRFYYAGARVTLDCAVLSESGFDYTPLTPQLASHLLSNIFVIELGN